MYKIVVLGVTGMLGHVLFSYLAGQPGLELYGTARNKQPLIGVFPENLLNKIYNRISIADPDSLTQFLTEVRPQLIINCIGLIKQRTVAGGQLQNILINALFPHRLAMIAADLEARLIQISTDCVFDGKKGMYTEADHPTPTDLYGRAKLLGELDYPHTLTLRTSIIGHELFTRYGLVEWFLSQTGTVPGFTGAIYSGVPTIELAKIISAYIIPRPEMRGLYHLGAEPITKYRLLQLIAAAYGHPVTLQPDQSLQADRSLNSALFQKVTGYRPPAWPDLIAAMRRHFLIAPYYQSKRKI